MTLDEMIKSVVDEAMNSESEFRSCRGRVGEREYLRLWKAKKRASIADGFPVNVPLSRKEADSYLAQEENVCLLCGWTGVLLGSHVVGRHKIKTTDYLQAYNLPLTAGLVCPSLKEKMMNLAKENTALIEAREAGRGEALRLAVVAHKKAFAARKGQKTYHTQSSSENIKAAQSLCREGAYNGTVPEPKYTQRDYLAVLSLMISNDMTVTEVLSNFETPKRTAFYEWTRACKANNDAYERALNSISFKAQARCQSLGQRFVDTITILLESGMTLAQASEQLGVSEMSSWHKLNGGRKELAK